MNPNYSVDFAAQMANRNCPTCWGQGAYDVNYGVGGPIVNPIVVDGTILRTGNVGVREKILCVCVRRKIERLEADGKDLQTGGTSKVQEKL